MSKTGFAPASVRRDGWQILPCTLTYSAVGQAGTSTSCGQNTVTTSVDVSGIVKAGDKISLVHGATTKFYIVSATTSSTLVLITKVNQADLSATAITSPLFSKAKNPSGFEPLPAKWRIVYTNTGNYNVNPDGSTWYHATSHDLPIVIGEWYAGYKCLPLATGNAAASGATSYGLVAVTLSTATTTAVDEFTVEIDTYTTESVLGITNTASAGGQAIVSRPLSLAALTTYYLNIRSRIDIVDVAIFGTIFTTRLEAVSAWL